MPRRGSAPPGPPAGAPACAPGPPRDPPEPHDPPPPRPHRQAKPGRRRELAAPRSRCQHHDGRADLIFTDLRSRGTIPRPQERGRLPGRRGGGVAEERLGGDPQTEPRARRRTLRLGSHHSRSCTRGLAARSPTLNKSDGEPGLGELAGDGAADDAAPDDQDVGRPRHHALPRTSRNFFVISLGRSAVRIAEITATPWAPAARTAATRSAVMPPIAKTRPLTALTTLARASTPCGGPYARLDGVSYTGPKTRKSAP